MQMYNTTNIYGSTKIHPPIDGVCMGLFFIFIQQQQMNSELSLFTKKKKTNLFYIAAIQNLFQIYFV